MAITFFPKAGTVLVCDFRGYESPEIISTRWAGISLSSGPSATWSLRSACVVSTACVLGPAVIAPTQYREIHFAASGSRPRSASALISTCCDRRLCAIPASRACKTPTGEQASGGNDKLPAPHLVGVSEGRPDGRPSSFPAPKELDRASRPGIRLAGCCPQSAQRDWPDFHGLIPPGYRGHSCVATATRRFT